MANIDRVPVFMQQEIAYLLKRADELNHEVCGITPYQWWVLTNVVDASQVRRNREYGQVICFMGYRFCRNERPKPRPGKVDLSDPVDDT